MCRVVIESRWSADLVLKITGTPMRPNPTVEDDSGDAWVEESATPHEAADLDVELVSKPAGNAEDRRQRAQQSLRIKKNDLLRYGYTEDSPKCEDIKHNKNFPGKHNSDLK